MIPFKSGQLIEIYHNPKEPKPWGSEIESYKQDFFISGTLGVIIDFKYRSPISHINVYKVLINERLYFVNEPYLRNLTND